MTNVWTGIDPSTPRMVEVASDQDGFGRLPCSNVQHDSDTQLRCTMPSGVGSLHLLWVTVDGQESEQPSRVSYQKPNPQAINIDKGSTVGGEFLIITGSSPTPSLHSCPYIHACMNVGENFGANEPGECQLYSSIDQCQDMFMVIHVAAAVCQNPTRLQAHTEVRCITPPWVGALALGQQQTVLVTIDGQTSELNELFDYSALRAVLVTVFPSIIRVQKNSQRTFYIETVLYLACPIRV